MIFGTIVLFDLQLDPKKNAISSRTGACVCVCVNVCEYRQFNFAFFRLHFFFVLAAFTYHQFNQFLKTVTIPCIWIGVLSLTWEIVTSMFRYDSPPMCVVDYVVPFLHGTFIIENIKYTNKMSNFVFF